MLTLVWRTMLLSLLAMQVNGKPQQLTGIPEALVCVPSGRLDFEDLFTKEAKPEVPEGACADDISAYRAAAAARSPCLQGYARHFNNRCYKIVDAPKDGRPLEKHEYRITYRGDCRWWINETQVSQLGKDRTVDFCDEDGGCVSQGERGVPSSAIPDAVCAKGMVASDGKCRRVVPDSATRRTNPKNN